MNHKQGENAVTLNKLGYLFYFLENYTQAESFYLEAKGIIQKEFGKEHPDYAQSLENLEDLYLSREEFYAMGEEFPDECVKQKVKTL
jgi:tetratricopeptide (TPR) repeat protein